MKTKTIEFPLAALPLVCLGEALCKGDRWAKTMKRTLKADGGCYTLVPRGRRFAITFGSDPHLLQNLTYNVGSAESRVKTLEKRSGELVQMEARVLDQLRKLKEGIESGGVTMDVNERRRLEMQRRVDGLRTGLAELERTPPAEGADDEARERYDSELNTGRALLANAERDLALVPTREESGPLEAETDRSFRVRSDLVAKINQTESVLNDLYKGGRPESDTGGPEYDAQVKRLEGSLSEMQTELEKLPMPVKTEGPRSGESPAEALARLERKIQSVQIEQQNVAKRLEDAREKVSDLPVAQEVAGKTWHFGVGALVGVSLTFDAAQLSDLEESRAHVQEQRRAEEQEAAEKKSGSESKDAAKKKSGSESKDAAKKE